MSRQPKFAFAIAVLSIAAFSYQLQSCQDDRQPPVHVEPRTDPVPEVAVDEIVEYSPVPVPDQVIECYDDTEVVSEFTRYLVLGGKVWLNNSSDLASRECVSDGTCHLGWYEGRLVHVARTPDLVRTELIDLDKKEMDVVVDMTSLLHGQDLEPQLQPIIPCRTSNPPIGISVVPEVSGQQADTK